MKGNKANVAGLGEEGQFERKPVRVVGTLPTGSCRQVKDFDLKCSEKSLGGF